MAFHLFGNDEAKNDDGAPATAASGELSGDNTVGEWLDHPVGGVIFRDMLQQAGQNESVLRVVKRFPLKKLVAMSQGKFTEQAMNDMIAKANSGEVSAAAQAPVVAAPAAPSEPETELPQWQEKLIEGRFTGKTIIVTGAGSGIGRATASRVAREGGRLIAVDMNEAGLQEFKASLPDADITTVVANITVEDDIKKVVDAAGDVIHGLANVAGIMDKMQPIGEADDAMWDKVIAVNLMGMVKLTRAALPHMLPLGNASIVNITSEAGLRGSSAGVAYTASKHAVIGATKSTAFMYGPQGLRTNAVAPGGVATNIGGESASELANKRLEAQFAAMPEIAHPEQLAASITFLLSDDSTNINGAILPSDGGWSAQ